MAAVLTEAFIDAIVDVLATLHDVGVNWETKRRILLGAVSSRLEATFTFSIPKFSSVLTGLSPAKKVKSIYW